MKKNVVIHWFRHDFRLEDNPALYEAAQEGLPLVAVYILDEDRLIGAQKIWLHLSLTELEKSLRAHSIHLWIEKGSPAKAFEKILKKVSPKKVTWNDAFEGADITRDKKIRNWLEKKGVEVETFNGSLLVEPEALSNQSGGYYKVFAPFFHLHQKIYNPPPLLKLPKRQQKTPAISGLTISQLHLLDHSVLSVDFVKTYEPGEAGAQKKLKRFITKALDQYAHNRDYPSLEGTSHLSAHLHWGEISPHAIVRSIEHMRKAGKNSFLRELVFRDFAYYVLSHFPKLPSAPFKNEFNRWKWSWNTTFFDAWKNGKTGYPLVDAGMRELFQTGFMHNRVRMVVASFLVKHLNISWVEGAKWFLQRLLDADLAINSYNWQWCAGTGLDAQPYFRIFNPILQSKKFDADGDYIRKWVPELKEMPAKFIHFPETAPAEVLKKAGVILGRTYPRPIVDHQKARKQALLAFKKLKG